MSSAVLRWVYGRGGGRKWVGLFYLKLSLFCLRLVLVAYGQRGLAFSTYGWSFLQTWFGKTGLVVFAYGSPIRKLGLVFSAYGAPTESRKDDPHAKRPKTSTVSKKDASVEIPAGGGLKIDTLHPPPLKNALRPGGGG